MLNDKGFDLWADGYDKDVGVADEEDRYPFAGYKKVLAGIYNTIMQNRGCSVLDIGFGTGVLTSKLYENGCRIYGQDFSERMTQLAQKKMPEAELYKADFTHGLAEPLLGQSYDHIVATYSLHHLTDVQKPGFIRSLLPHINKGGMLLIGDVAFMTRAELESCRLEAGEKWDDEEYYFVIEELKCEFPGLRFKKVSRCAGIISLS